MARGERIIAVEKTLSASNKKRHGAAPLVTHSLSPVLETTVLGVLWDSKKRRRTERS